MSESIRGAEIVIRRSRCATRCRDRTYMFDCRMGGTGSSNSRCMLGRMQFAKDTNFLSSKEASTKVCQRDVLETNCRSWNTVRPRGYDRLRRIKKISSLLYLRYHQAEFHICKECHFCIREQATMVELYRRGIRDGKEWQCYCTCWK